MNPATWLQLFNTMRENGVSAGELAILLAVVAQGAGIMWRLAKVERAVRKHTVQIEEIQTRQIEEDSPAQKLAVSQG